MRSPWGKRRGLQWSIFRYGMRHSRNGYRPAARQSVSPADLKDTETSKNQERGPSAKLGLWMGYSILGMIGCVPLTFFIMFLCVLTDTDCDPTAVFKSCFFLAFGSFAFSIIAAIIYSIYARLNRFLEKQLEENGVNKSSSDIAKIKKMWMGAILLLLAVLLTGGIVSIDKYFNYVEETYQKETAAYVVNTIADFQYPVEVIDVTVTKSKSSNHVNYMTVTVNLKQTGIVFQGEYAPCFDELRYATIGESWGNSWQICDLEFQIENSYGTVYSYTSSDFYDSQYYFNTYTDWGKNQKKIKEQAETYSDLKLSKGSVDRYGGSVWYRGTITNTGEKTYSFIRVEGVFYDKNRRKVTTKETIAVFSSTGPPLRAGKSASFEFRVYTNDKVWEEIDTYDIFITEVKTE